MRILVVSAVLALAALVAPVSFPTIAPEAAAAACVGAGDQRTNTYYGAGGGQITVFTGMVDSCTADEMVALSQKSAAASAFLNTLTARIPGVGWANSFATAVAGMNTVTLQECAKPKRGINVTVSNGIVTSCNPQ